MDAVLPIAPKDFPRASELLLPSLRLNGHFVSKLFCVVPRGSEHEAERAVSTVGGLPCEVEVLSEWELVPELINRPHLGGWARQQVIKLAASRVVSTPAYVTLDSDVLCVWPTTESDLAPDGKPLLIREPREVHENWWRWSAAALDLEMVGSGCFPTPFVFSIEGMHDLASFIEQHRVSPGRRALAAVTPKRHQARMSGWLSILLTLLPWTEYGLYVTLLEARGLVNTYHTEVLDSAEGEPLMGNCVWDARSFDSWNPDASFRNGGQFHFSVVQSNQGIPVEAVSLRIADHL